MLVPNKGCSKKVQFCATLALLLVGLEAGAMELTAPMAGLQQQLTEKTDAVFAQKLEECREKAREERSRPRFPVRIAEDGFTPDGASSLLAGMQMTAL